jgi:hypothetical protein
MKTALTYEKFVHDNYEYLKTFCDKHVYVANSVLNLKHTQECILCMCTQMMM